jgi:hypothetical protein
MKVVKDDTHPSGGTHKNTVLFSEALLNERIESCVLCKATRLVMTALG